MKYRAYYKEFYRTKPYWNGYDEYVKNSKGRVKVVPILFDSIEEAEAYHREKHPEWEFKVKEVKG